MQHENIDDQPPKFKVNGAYNFSPECHLPATALTCLNSLKHGGSSRMMFIPGEQPQDFYKYLAESFETHKPVTTEDSALVTDAVVARWFLWRRQRAHYKREFEIFNEADQQDSPSPSGLAELERFDRYRTQAERALNRAIKNLQTIKKDTLSEEKWRAQLELQKEKFQFQLKNFELRQGQHQLKVRVNEAKEKKQWAEDNRFSPVKFAHYLVNSNGVNAIGQKAYIATDPQGLVSVTLEPSNEIVLSIIEHRHEFFVVHPQHVARTTHFAEGTVPSNYQWTLKNATPDLIASLSDPDVGITTTLSFEFFRKLASDEHRLQPAA